jgi:hypothetical protein
MKVKKGLVGAPEIGRAWLNSAPLSLRQLRGRPGAVAFPFATCLDPGAIPSEAVG